ncbi:hypothetical protein GDO86_006628, partial [Hymenochirus boettgeri]
KDISSPSSLDSYLDLSEQNLVHLHASNFSSQVKFLNLSYNAIEELDCSVFQFSSALEILDLSNNRLHTIHCNTLQFIQNIRQLDLSMNNFETLDLCREFIALSQLTHLGLSAKVIRKYSFLNIAPRQLGYVFLGIQNLKEYENGSLQLLNTKKLHIVLPPNQANSCLLCDALDTSAILEISEVQCSEQCDYITKPFSNITKNSKVSTLIISDSKMSGPDIIQIVQSVWYSSVEHLHIRNFVLVKEFRYVKVDYTNYSLKSITIEGLTNSIFYYNPPHPLNIFAEMMVENGTFSDVQFIHFFCPPKPSIFKHLNLANNRITDEIFLNCENVSTLESLNLQNNKLEEMSIISVMTTTMRNLRHLDVSKNGLSYEITKQCRWTESLVFLNLSENRLTESFFECLPINLQILDLSKNQITRVPAVMEGFSSLKELYLVLNRLIDIPKCSSISSSLAVLNVDENSISSLTEQFFNSCQHVKMVSARRNPFLCNCDLMEFVKVEAKSPGKFDGWPESYQCQHPDNLKGVFLKDLHLSEISCNISKLLGVVFGVIIFTTLCIVFTCVYFDVPWYIRMIFQWIRTKHRARNISLSDLQTNKVFHAFVSYSQEDSIWVKNMLLPNLERKDGSIRICHHERHFLPGRAIIENIIDCIEKSFKSIFVLSPNFIQSEWCHYELYFAQHTLFGKNSNNLILILLDPIPQYLIPNKYSKLKSIMKHRTYLEWPKEKGKRGLFWANLREAISVNLCFKENVTTDPE